MFLKTLTLKGFKSFADPTTIELEPGITVVVGPNGSGKSNVVDAVAWVLGAQGPKVVRSTKMDDVIFAGTSRRPALGRAEVSLTIDNASRRLPVEVAEVTITRTLFRTGESEYALNGAPCRLLDIQELLSDAGVGRQQHVIVSQGQLDSVLQARPEDRRMVIEEAAGVLKFRRRRERAERRLESSEQNLLRLQDLQREVRRQLRPLERQAEAARRHDGLVAELRALRLHLAGRELSSLGRRLESAERSHAELTGQEVTQRNELARLDDLVATTESALTELQAWDGADRLGRAERLLERQRGVANVVAERRRTVAGSLAAVTEADVVASLEAESSRLAADLSAAEAAAGSLVPERETLERLEDELRRDEAKFEAVAGPGDVVGYRSPGAARGLVRHWPGNWTLAVPVNSTTRRSPGCRTPGRRWRDWPSVLPVSIASARSTSCAWRSWRRSWRLPRSSTDDSGPSTNGLSRRSRLPRRVNSESESRARTATDRSHTLEARAEALQAALDETRARAGVERLAGLPGVLGTLADVVDIDDGCERGFEAAVEDALGTVVVDGTGAARDACATCTMPASTAACCRPVGRRLSLARARAAAHPARRAGRSCCGIGSGQRLPASAPCLTGFSPASCSVGAGSSKRFASLRSCLSSTIVTIEGDRLSARGWRIGVARSGATRAALETVRRDAESAVELARTAMAGAEADREMLAGARAATVEATRRFDNAVATRTQAEVAQAQLAQRLVQLEAERERRVVGPRGWPGTARGNPGRARAARSRARQS